MFIIFFLFLVSTFYFYFLFLTARQFVTRHPPPATRYRPPATRHPLPATRHPSPATSHPPPVTRHLRKSPAEVLTQVKMKSIFRNIKEKCNIPFSKQIQTVMVLNIF